MAYFERTSDTAFRATEHVGGAWNQQEQHIAPSLGLLVHVLELDHAARRPDGRLQIHRISYDILGTVPVDVVETEVRVLRPGRTIELIEATMSHGGRAIVIARAWFLQHGDTAGLAGSALDPVPDPHEADPWDPTTLWPGGFIESVEVRRSTLSPGRGVVWVRTPLPLVAGEPCSRLASWAGLLDIANGMNVRVSPEEVAFPNVDLTVHLFRQPTGEWLGLDTSVSVGATGVGLTSSRVHDVRGPVGTLAQLLTVRPKLVPPIAVVEHDPAWASRFDEVASVLREALGDLPARVEHVGSTSVPGLAAKPILDIDVIVDAEQVPAALRALHDAGYQHRGDLGVTGREAFFAPDASPRRNVYLCTADTLHVRNHLAVRDVLRSRGDLRDAYGQVKQELAADPYMDIETYIARKSAVLQQVLAESDLTAEELQEIRRLNDPDA